MSAYVFGVVMQPVAKAAGGLNRWAWTAVTCATGAAVSFVCYIGCSIWFVKWLELKTEYWFLVAVATATGAAISAVLGAVSRRVVTSANDVGQITPG